MAIGAYGRKSAQKLNQLNKYILRATRMIFSL
jgi:hypothetical protein